MVSNNKNEFHLENTYISQTFYKIFVLFILK